MRGVCGKSGGIIYRYALNAIGDSSFCCLSGGRAGALDSVWVFGGIEPAGDEYAAQIDAADSGAFAEGDDYCSGQG